MDVYTDGAYSSKTKIAGYGVVFPDRPDLNEGGRVPLPHHTNQRAELFAIQRALEKFSAPTAGIAPGTQLRIHSDSAYSIGCFTTWLPGWKARGWRKADGELVLNLDIIKMVDGMITRLGGPSRVEFIKVRAHSGHPHNDAADKLATSFIRGA